jgi:hypothetical protein
MALTDRGRYFDELGLDRDIESRRSQVDLQPAGPSAPAPAPTEAQTPGPVETPNEGQTSEPPRRAWRNRAPAPPPPANTPPPAASAVQGVEGSGETGGVRGSFRQAGTAGFQRRFGGNAPALWYRRSLEQMTPDVARDARGFSGGRSGSISGGTASSAGSPTADLGGANLPSGDDPSGGRPGDADMQRLLAEALRRMFGSGGA